MGAGSIVAMWRRRPGRLGALLALGLAAGGGWWSSRPPLTIRAWIAGPGGTVYAVEPAADGRSVALAQVGPPRLVRLDPRAWTITPLSPEGLAAWGTVRPVGGEIAYLRPDGREPSGALVSVVDPHDGTEIARIVPGVPSVVRLSFAKDGGSLYVLLLDSPVGQRSARPREVQVWDAATWTLRETINVPEDAAAVPWISMAGGGLGLVGVTPSDLDAASLWAFPGLVRRDYRAGRPGDPVRVLSAWATPDGTWLTGKLADESVAIWDVATGELRALLPARPGFAAGVADVSRDGRWALTGESRLGALPLVDQARALLFGGTRGRARGSEYSIVWDLETRTRAAVLRDQLPLCVTPDGEAILTQGIDGGLTLWALPASGPP